jgi:hypothetical protein
VPERRVGWRTRVLGWLARRFGLQFVLPTIAGTGSRQVLVGAIAAALTYVLGAVLGTSVGG